MDRPSEIAATELEVGRLICARLFVYRSHAFGARPMRPSRPGRHADSRGSPWPPRAYRKTGQAGAYAGGLGISDIRVDDLRNHPREDAPHVGSGSCSIRRDQKRRRSQKAPPPNRSATNDGDLRTACYRLVSDMSSNSLTDTPRRGIHKHQSPPGTSRLPVRWPKSWNDPTRCKNTPPATSQTRWSRR